MGLTQEQRLRYGRHLALNEVGEAGQEKLLQSNVLIIGAGGLGSPVAYYLAAAGVGNIGLVDSDTVDISNLQRQILYTNDDIGKAKVYQAKAKLKALNPDVTITPYHQRFDSENAQETCQGYDVAVDCTDNFAARFILNDTCLKLGIPWVHAGVYKYFGQIFSIIPGQGPCLRCLYPNEDDVKNAPDCSDDGIIGALPGVLGTLQALTAIKVLLNLGNNNTESILYFDGLNMSFDKIPLVPRKDCICLRSGDSLR